VFRIRHQSYIALIALFGLLFQQIAMATYRCPIEQSGQTPAQQSPAAQQAPCHSADPTDDAADPARCAQHCHPVTASVDNAAPLTVPPGLLTEAWALPLALRSVAVAKGISRTPISPHTTAPPLTVQHCTFQI
jgi:hypothetical protein